MCPRSAAVSVTCPRYLYTYAGRKKWTGVFSILAAGCILVRVFAIEVTEPAGAAHGFPGLCDINGNKLANGEFRQWVEGNQLHVVISYDFDDGQWFEEKALFRQHPELIQESWSWKEFKNGKLSRQFTADFREKRLLRCYAGITRRNSSRRTWKSNRDGPLLDLALPHVDLSARRGSSDLLGAAPCLERWCHRSRSRGTSAPVRRVRLRSGQDFLSEQAVRSPRDIDPNLQ